MSFVAGIEKLALSVGRDGEDLTFVAGGDVQRAVGCEGEIPDVFCFWVEEDQLFAGRRDAIDLAVGRGADVERSLGVEGNRLRREIARLKHRGGLAAGIEAENFGRRATRCVERTFGIEPE